MNYLIARSIGISLALVILLLAAVGIAALSSSRRIDDLWNDKIAEWQERARAGDLGNAALGLLRTDARRGVAAGEASKADAHGAATLRAEYETFRTGQRRALAAQVTRWVQRESTQHYRDDGPGDDWPTVSETLDGDGDDCDGLELLAYTMLRDLGFGESSVYRAIVRRRSDSLHHMVTLWLEDPNDPWVIDPTGVMAPELRRFSEIPGWTPIKLFSETETFTPGPPGPDRFPGKPSIRREQQANKSCAARGQTPKPDPRSPAEQRAGGTKPAARG